MPDNPRLGPIDGVVFDTDGVITRTATVHRSSWKRLFDDYLAEHAEEQPPFSDEDYLAHVDGKPRYDGVADFLASRGIKLPHGDRSDSGDQNTVCGLGNRKNQYFRDEIAQHGVAPYDSTIFLVDALRAAGVAVAAVSASENQRLVLDAAKLTDRFDVLVDGAMARDLGLAGKPDPALFLEAARRLRVEPSRAAVVEDARSGVAAGRAGGFVAVIGVDRGGRPDELRAAGAHLVVDDLDELLVHPLSAGVELRPNGFS
jgi:alpha,alpha-trehalase